MAALREGQRFAWGEPVVRTILLVPPPTSTGPITATFNSPTSSRPSRRCC